tara:strand:- start:256 stop:471 length:216 start_codon:yes stop_codon:yes gene_type:complete
MHKHTHRDKHDSSGRIAWAFFLNVGFTIIEFIGGWLTNSTAIMADAALIVEIRFNGGNSSLAKCYSEQTHF